MGCADGDFRLTVVSDGSNTLSPGPPGSIELHPNSLADAGQIRFAASQAFHE